MNQGIFSIGPIPLSGMLLVLVTVYLNHLLANTRDKVTMRREKAKAIIIAFNPELEALLETTEDCRFILTEEAYIKHQRAIRDYMLYLSWIDRLRLELIWTRLAKIKIGKQKIEFYDQYADCGSLKKRRQMRPLAIRRIEKIIAFAAR
jgi:hypothetical protein